MRGSRWTENARRRARQAVELFGLKVECMRCGWQGRHPHETLHPTGLPSEVANRVRNARCPNCNAVHMRAVWWTKRYPSLALAERRQYDRD